MSLETKDVTAREICSQYIAQVNSTHAQVEQVTKQINAENITALLFAMAMIHQQSAHCGTRESIALRKWAQSNAEETKDTYVNSSWFSLSTVKHGANIAGGLFGVVATAYSMTQGAASARATRAIARSGSTAGQMVHGTIDAGHQGQRTLLQGHGSALNADKQNSGQSNQRTEGMVDASLQKASESSNTRHQTFGEFAR